jgi:transcriptional regulator with XRE-family HTH domain
VSDPRRSEIWRHSPTRRAIERELRRLGGRLRALREGREWTLEQTAERASIHAVTLSRIETGQTNVTVATLVAISRAFGIELAELFAPGE